MAQSRPPKIKSLGNRTPTPKKNRRVGKSKLDQFFTKPEVADMLYAVFRKAFDPSGYLMVEPSAGQGAFFRLLPPGSLGYDIEPQFFGVAKADFLKVELPRDRKIAIVGNPPFGTNANVAVRFFNHAAGQADVIAMILPRSFRKASIENRLNSDFHLLREEPVARDAFLHKGRTFEVSTIFQIWVRRPTKRLLRVVETTHPDFEFTTPERCDCVVQRVGARAGRVHNDLTASPSSHYFIRGPVQSIMTRLSLASAAADATGNPSLAKSEIVALYSAYTCKNAAVSTGLRLRPQRQPKLKLASLSRRAARRQHRWSSADGTAAAKRRLQTVRAIASRKTARRWHVIGEPGISPC